MRAWKEQDRESVPLVEVIEVLIPCILHLENHVGEKIMTIIIRKALDEYWGQKEAFLAHMNNIFKTRVLGSDQCPSQWNIPFSKDDNSNYKVKRIPV